MITLQEIQALLELADRSPKSAAEQLWLNELVQSINEQVKQQSQQQVGGEAEYDN